MAQRKLISANIENQKGPLKNVMNKLATDYFTACEESNRHRRIAEHARKELFAIMKKNDIINFDFKIAGVPFVSIIERKPGTKIDYDKACEHIPSEHWPKIFTVTKEALKQIENGLAYITLCEVNYLHTENVYVKKKEP